MSYPNYMDSKTNSPVLVPADRSCMSGQAWKRFSVFISICLSAASLIVYAFAALKTVEPSTLKALQISGIILNSASITLSAITSLEWRSQAAQEAKFVNQLLALVNVHSDGKISLGRRRHHRHV